MVITLLLLLTAIIFLTVAIFEAKIARNQIIDKKSFYVTEAGLNKSFNYIKLYPGLVPSGTEINGDLDGMDYTCTITLLSEKGDPIKIYEIVCIAYDSITGARKKITTIIRLQTFAKYAYYTNNEVSVFGTTIWFLGIPQVTDILGKKAWVSPDEVSRATLHTNTKFAFYGNPEFWAEVESVSKTALFYETILKRTYELNADKHEPGAIPVFKKSFSRGVANIPFPENIDNIKEAPPSEILDIAPNSTIVFNGTSAIVNGTPHDISNIKVIHSTGNLDISGTLDGQITVATEGKIFIVDNLTYAYQSPHSDDVLGLFAKNDIVVKNDEDIAPGIGKDITIDASIVSLTKFTIYPYSGGSWNHPYGRKPCATLHVNGGIIQNIRGVMSHFSLSSGCQDGYIKDYRYDDRLLDLPPPYFPTTGEPEILSWKEEIIE